MALLTHGPGSFCGEPMFKFRFAVLALGLCAAAFLPSVAKADSITYDFSYSGTGTFINGELASGTGSFTIEYTTLGNAVLSAFTFTDTLNAPSGKSSIASTFSYNLSDITSQSIVLGGTLADPILTNIQLGTSDVAGSNNDFGAAGFGLAYSGANPGVGDTNGTTGQNLNDFTNGQTTLGGGPTLGAVPEPATYALLATGLFGFAFLYRGNRQASKA
jgi:hypothetical protein